MRLSFASVLVLCSVLPHFAFAAGETSGGGDSSAVAFYEASLKEAKLQLEADGTSEKDFEALKKAKILAVDSKKSSEDISRRLKENACGANSAFLPFIEKEVAAIYPESSTIRINQKAWEAIAKDETSKSFVILYSAYKLSGRSNSNIAADIQKSLKNSGKCGLATTPTYKAKSAPAATPSGAVGGQD